MGDTHFVPFSWRAFVPSLSKWQILIHTKDDGWDDRYIPYVTTDYVWESASLTSKLQLSNTSVRALATLSLCLFIGLDWCCHKGQHGHMLLDAGQFQHKNNEKSYNNRLLTRCMFVLYL
eukprot:937811_1